MTRKKQPDTRTSRRHRGQADAGDAVKPRLFFDFIVSASIVGWVAFLARDWVNPDGVAYLEAAEAIVRGHWESVIQGYWSPGYPILLAPLVAMAGDDRPLLLRLAHVVQASLGVGTLSLAISATRRRVPAPMQRAAFWVAAWVIIVWLSQELITPDLALCACLLGVVVLMDRSTPRARIGMGFLVSAGFLLKTSSWPWLGVAAVLVALPAARRRRLGALPLHVLAPPAAIVGAWLVVLGVHTGHPTLGSVGPLNMAWYLGDPDRRTPDTDLGPHALAKQMALPDGTMVTFTDLRGTGSTYLPWSDPERWSQGVPADSRPKFELDRAVRTWRDNLVFALRYMVPALLGLAACAWMAGARDRRPSPWRWTHDRPMLVTGLAALAAFLVVHPEQRLVAPGMLLCSFGVLASTSDVRPSGKLRIASTVLLAILAMNVAMYLTPRRAILTQNRQTVTGWRTYFDSQLGRNHKLGAVVVGPAMPWMRMLWVQHMRVVAQFGSAGSPSVMPLSPSQRAEWLRAEFGDVALGYAQAVSSFENGRVNTLLQFVPW